MIIVVGILRNKNEHKRLEELMLSFINFDKDYEQIILNYITEIDIEQFKENYEHSVKKVIKHYIEKDEFTSIITKYEEIVNNFVELNIIYVDNYVDNLLTELTDFSNDYEQIKIDYITTYDIEKFKNKYASKIDILVNAKYKNEKSENLVRRYKDLIENFRQLNEVYIEKTLVEKRKYFDNIYGVSLDTQQRKAVIVDDLNNIIIAGAGSGKTLTIAAKIKYLIEQKNVDPSEILCISFTNASVQGLKEKNKEYNVDTTTFHKLGLKILRENHNNVYIADDQTLNTVIATYFNKHILDDADLIDNIIDFFAYYINPLIDMDNYANLGEYYEQQRGVDLVTFKEKLKSINNNSYEENIIGDMRKAKYTLGGEIVKSEQELIIANYLFLNGIKYEYEMQYKADRKLYKPDFYLVDYDIYLEHFGINKDGKVPWLPPFEEQKYIDSMKWKRNLHKEKGTKLIETYSYSFYNKNPDKILDNLMQKHNIIKNPIPIEEILKVITTYKKSKQFNEFRKLISTFINLFKSFNFEETHFDDLLTESSNEGYNHTRNTLFLKIVRRIYSIYEETLNDTKQIDFHDMINNSIQLLEETQYNSNYKYIIIDEFQDTSMVKTNLVKKLIEISNAKLIVVGDDWQSIYRFAGSDSTIFKNFEDIFGEAQLLKIENTYRNSQQLIDVASGFIMKNDAQIPKQLKSLQKLEKPIKIIHYGNENNLINKFEILINRIYEHNKQKSIFVLLRNNHDLNLILESDKFSLEGRKLVYISRKEIKITVSTVHASKGLESDNVIILGLENKIAAFPNKIVDDPLLDLIKSDDEEFLYAEERRLFYVALTRTKNFVYLFKPYSNPSVFVEEIKKNKHVEIILSEEKKIEDINCPKCIKGNLIVREGIGNAQFLGCVNYPKCDSTFSTKSMQSILKYNIKCPKCGGFLVERAGTYGMFFGCTNYPECKSTLDFNEAKAQNKKKAVT